VQSLRSGLDWIVRARFQPADSEQTDFTSSLSIILHRALNSTGYCAIDREYKIVRKWLVIIGAVLVAVVGVVAALPWLAELNAEWTCSHRVPSQTCVIAMRGMGHVWSQMHDLNRAKRWYARAAENGDTEAMFHLAWIYEQSAMTQEQASMRRQHDWEWSEQATNGGAEQRFSLATANSGPETDIEFAEYWYRRSAERGFAPAMNNLGELYLGVPGLREDVYAAFDRHMAAARAGNPVGRINVGLAYQIGRGVEHDPAEADKWMTWIPGATDTADLQEMTFARTKLFGSPLAPHDRALYRAAAAANEPLHHAFEPLRPNPSVPTFNEVHRTVDQP
jgi:hypothetical protein